jgi:hypothetical protein
MPSKEREGREYGLRERRGMSIYRERRHLTTEQTMSMLVSLGSGCEAVEGVRVFYAEGRSQHANL